MSIQNQSHETQSNPQVPHVHPRPTAGEVLATFGLTLEEPLPVERSRHLLRPLPGHGAMLEAARLALEADLERFAGDRTLRGVTPEALAAASARLALLVGAEAVLDTALRSVRGERSVASDAAMGVLRKLARAVAGSADAELEARWAFLSDWLSSYLPKRKRQAKEEVQAQP